MQNQNRPDAPAHKRMKSISLSEAKMQTNNWREYLKNKVRDYDINMLNRGAFIPIDDILELARIHSTPEQKITGVRAYFAIDDKVADKERDPLHHVKVIMVPVKEGGRNGIDVLPENDNAPSSIYDFTMPCPDCCDKGSSLY